MNKKILVQYQGGGYSGCFWEWNYFCMIDGVFHNIFSSGRDGIENEQDAKNLLDSDNTHYVYDLTDEKAIEEFCNESNVCNMSGVLQFFEDNDLGIEFFAVCSDCGCKIISNDELILENWHGCGGIASTADKLLCVECHSIGMCECCNEYVGQDNIVEYEEEYICTYCKEWREEQKEKERLEDLRFNSLLLGEPDMFSDELRDFWV